MGRARFAANPRLEYLAQIPLNAPEVMRLPRQIVRHFHQGPVSSRAHTDCDYLRQGSDRILTMGIPIGDCPVPVGGLAYLDNSHANPHSTLDGLEAPRSNRPGDSRPMSHDLGWT